MGLPNRHARRALLLATVALSTSCSAQLFTTETVPWSVTFPLVWSRSFVEFPDLSLFVLAAIVVGVVRPTPIPLTIGCLGAAAWFLLGLMCVGLLVT